MNKHDKDNVRDDLKALGSFCKYFDAECVAVALIGVVLAGAFFALKYNGVL